MGSAHLTDAQKADPTEYEPGDLLQFHQNAPGYKKGSRLIVGEGIKPPTELAKRFEVYRPTQFALAVGDRVRVTAGGKTKDGKHRLSNGSLLTVQGFTKRGDIIVDHGWVIDRDFGHLTHGYVVTSHASQGVTVDKVFIGVSSESFPATYQRTAYVAVTRGKEQALIFTDDRKELLKAVSRPDDPLSATELSESTTTETDIAGSAEEAPGDSPAGWRVCGAEPFSPAGQCNGRDAVKGDGPWRMTNLPTHPSGAIEARRSPGRPQRNSAVQRDRSRGRRIFVRRVWVSAGHPRAGRCGRVPLPGWQQHVVPLQLARHLAVQPDPTGCLLKFSGDVVYLVLIRGSNLDRPLSDSTTNLTTSGLQRHRIVWMREMTEEEIRQVGETGPTIDSIEVTEFESHAALKEWLRKNAPAFER